MLLVIALGIGALSLLLNIVGLAIPYWMVWKGHVTVDIGLWKSCIDGTCVLLDDRSEVTSHLVTAGVKATRAMEVLEVLALGAALLCIVLKLFVMKERKLLPTIAGIGAIVAGVLGIIGCIVYASTVRPDYQSKAHSGDLTLSSGFALCIVSGIGSVATGVLAWFNSRGE